MNELSTLRRARPFVSVGVVASLAGLALGVSAGSAWAKAGAALRGAEPAVDVEPLKAKIKILTDEKAELEKRLPELSKGTGADAQRQLEDAKGRIAEIEGMLKQMNAMLSGATGGSDGSVPVVSSDGRVVGVPQAADCPLKFEKPVHDFGKISDEAPVSHQFKFKNTSTKVITISNVQTSCGCTAAELSADERVVEPGAEGKIKITFNPANRNGRESKQIIVNTDAPECPQITLTASSEVVKQIIVEPQVIFFGELPIGQKAQPQTFTITGRKDGFEVTSITVNNEKLKLEPLGKETVDLGGSPGTRFRYRLSLADGLPLGLVQGLINYTTNDSRFPTPPPTMVNAVVVGPVNVMPRDINLPFTKQGDPFRTQVRLLQRDGKPMRIVSAEVEGMSAAMKPVVDVRPIPYTGPNGTQLANVMYEFVLAGTLPAQWELVGGTLVVKTDQPAMETIRVPVRAYPTAPMVVAPRPTAQTPAAAPAPTPAPAVAPGAAPAAGAPTGSMPAVNPRQPAGAGAAGGGGK